MSINCINKCLHQLEGCCTLEELPSVSQSMITDDNNMIDCPYFKSTI